MGETDEHGTATVAFGPLFYKHDGGVENRLGRSRRQSPQTSRYADISDSLVGVLMRAKKRKRLYYAGDMLFQGSSDRVVISVPKDA